MPNFHCFSWFLKIKPQLRPKHKSIGNLKKLSDSFMWRNLNQESTKKEKKIFWNKKLNLSIKPSSLQIKQSLTQILWHQYSAQNFSISIFFSFFFTYTLVKKIKNLVQVGSDQTDTEIVQPTRFHMSQDNVDLIRFDSNFLI